MTAAPAPPALQRGHPPPQAHGIGMRITRSAMRSASRSDASPTGREFTVVAGNACGRVALCACGGARAAAGRCLTASGRTAGYPRARTALTSSSSSAMARCRAAG
jgi:hypothetical protein